LKDHGAGEIADFVLVDPAEKTVVFYHCKASSKKKAGARIKDLQVLEQAYRSIHWIRRDLPHEIAMHAIGEERPKSRLVKGSNEMAMRLAKQGLTSEWTYEVVVVQPGLNCKQALGRKNTNTLLVTCYEWLSNLGASFSIMAQ
ncbi:MAG: hypothetical protein JSV10_03145, partial [Candidatus Zixiibacteriota bacterium]